VKVSVYVPFVLLPTVAVLVALVEPDGVTDAGERLQVIPAGAPQESVTAPEKPFFVYYVPGATHDPHQPTKSAIRP
jgi:hypothetical protein